ncbi:thermonuclease family protein [Microbacterium oleivorans]|uniref:thermonuclease family protein n=1 Tax=Microbacterium oleivorans TaxID=273677 RepID=UPI000561978D|nr:thermonuclease family protein [Microbacterium oleivorans]
MTTPRRTSRSVIAGFVGALLLAGLWAAASTLRGTPTDDIPTGAVAYTVERVVDGDTLIARDGGDRLRIRLIGIDTPELRPSPECGADAAKDRLRNLAPEGDRIWATADREPTDRYDRALRYLWTDDGDFINESLVAEGHAETLRIPPNIRYAEQFAGVEAAARAAHAGRWGTC